MPRILLTDEARSQLDALAKANPAKHQKVLKTLGLMETNLRHPGLNTHAYTALAGTHGEKVFESYVENNTPAAYRIFWFYGAEKGAITVIAITPHP